MKKDHKVQREDIHKTHYNGEASVNISLAVILECYLH